VGRADWSFEVAHRAKRNRLQLDSKNFLLYMSICLILSTYF
jgi:hypothetical protein